jgi:pimeloyl-ACP methyl ester carboxylesterase
VNITYDDLGAGDPALVFIHGWCCDRSYFAPQVDHFSASHRVVAVDQRGHGKTPPADDGDYSVAAFAGDAAELIRTLGLDRPVVVGHSLGGVVALALAASQPDLVRGVVMVDPAPIVMSNEMKAMFGQIASLVATVDGRKAFVAGMFAPMDDQARKEQIVAGMSSMPDDVAVAAVAGLGQFDGPAALRTIRCPIATIGSISPTNTQAQLQEHCPHLLVAQTLGAGHFNQLEVPDQVNTMIERFLTLGPPPAELLPS